MTTLFRLSLVLDTYDDPVDDITATYAYNCAYADYACYLKIARFLMSKDFEDVVKRSSLAWLYTTSYDRYFLSYLKKVAKTIRSRERWLRTIYSRMYPVYTNYGYRGAVILSVGKDRLREELIPALETFNAL